MLTVLNGTFKLNSPYLTDIVNDICELDIMYSTMRTVFKNQGLCYALLVILLYRDRGYISNDHDRIPANTKHVYYICTMLHQRQRRWSYIVQM